MSDQKLLPGKFVWFELETEDAKRAQAQAFFAEVFGWTTKAFPMGASTYEMMYAGDTMLGGYAPTKDAGRPSSWLSYVSVKDVDATVKAALAEGGKVIDPPADIGVGRRARIADPQGAELALISRTQMGGDPPDSPTTPHGQWIWNELHTSDPPAAIAFYEKAIGFAHREMPMGPGHTYTIVSQGGVDRGGVTQNQSPIAPHWLPYIAVDDADATAAKVTKAGGKILQAPMDIPQVGRFAVLKDPTGGAVAILKAMPRER